MRRLFPHPLLSLVMLLVWLTLNNTVAPAHILLGALLACVLPLTGLHLTDGTWPRLHRPLVIVKLALRVLLDIVVSNVDPKRTFLKLMDPKDLPPEFVAAIKRIDYSSATVKINVAVSEPLSAATAELLTRLSGCCAR